MSRPPETLGVRHVALFVADVARSEAFYCGLLGYTVQWRPDDENVYLTQGGQDNLALHKGKVPPAETRLDHFGLMLKEQADVDAWHAHLGSAGVRIVKAPKTHRDGARSFYAADPDGTVIQFIHMRRD